MKTQKETKEKKISYYQREIMGFLAHNQIFDDNNKLVGFKLFEHNFILSNPSSWGFEKEKTFDYSSSTALVKEKYTMIKISKEFLDKEIFNVSNSEFANDNSKLFSKVELE